VQLPGYPGSPTKQEYESRVIRLLDRASVDLLAAAALGEPEANEWLGVIRLQFNNFLPRLKLGGRIAARTVGEWRDAAALAGEWAITCRAAAVALQELIGRVGRYSRAEFDAGVAQARQCLDRAPGSAAAQWYDAAEYAAVKPRPTAVSRYPDDFPRTSDALPRLLFEDAATQSKDKGT
jgi:hypothetical protein